MHRQRRAHPRETHAERVHRRTGRARPLPATMSAGRRSIAGRTSRTSGRSRRHGKSRAGRTRRRTPVLPAERRTRSGAVARGGSSASGDREVAASGSRRHRERRTSAQPDRTPPGEPVGAAESRARSGACDAGTAGRNPCAARRDRPDRPMPRGFVHAGLLRAGSSKAMALPGIARGSRPRPNCPASDDAARNFLARPLDASRLER